MKVLKFVGLVLLVFLVIALVLPVIMPETASTSQSVQINASAPVAFRLVNNPKNWKRWSPFELDNPEMTSIYDGPEQGKGAGHRWESEEMGSGSMLIVESEPYKFIQSQLDFGNHGLALDEWEFIENENGVEVVWTLKLSELTYPFGKYFGFFLDGLMNPMQEKGLKKLKEIAESYAETVIITEQNFESLNCLAVSDSVYRQDISAFMLQSKSLLEDYFSKVNITKAGNEFLIYNSQTDNEKIGVTYAFPVYDEAREYGTIVSFTRPAGRVLQSIHHGDYTAIDAVHFELQQVLRDRNLPLDVLIMEEFVGDVDTTIIVSYYLKAD
ncbi:MAG: SRPBCC family protein [Bacteroidetes bacterium]|jgi:effector-binding domain-containing protein|nr:SRPBCC family protein [Bacteroidota bacterium]